MGSSLEISVKRGNVSLVEFVIPGAPLVYLQHETASFLYLPEDGAMSE